MTDVAHIRAARLALAGLLASSDDEAASAMIRAVYDEIDSDPDPSESRAAIMVAALELLTDVLVEAFGSVDNAAAYLRRELLDDQL